MVNLKYYSMDKHIMKWLFITTVPLLLISLSYQLGYIHYNNNWKQIILNFVPFNPHNNKNNSISKDIDLDIMRPFDSPIPATPNAPFPISTDKYCDIVCGFGRGSSELGIPTANVEISELTTELNALDFGVYFGFAHLKTVEGKETAIVQRKDGRNVSYNYGNQLVVENGDLDVIPMVLSMGKNPFFGNEFKTVELHILHKFSNNFYGAEVKFNILGYIRPELDYTTAEALIQDINTDIEIAKKVLKTPEYSKFKEQIAN